MEPLWEAANTYSLVITRRSASEILLVANSSGWELPRIAIRPQRRVAEQVNAEVARRWGLEAYCLSFWTPSQGGDGRCAVMEAVRDNQTPPETCWTPRASAKCVEPQEMQMVRQSTDELDAHTKDGKACPFARPGWLRELFLWVRKQLAPSRLRLTGGFRQLNASPTFSLIRLEVERGAVWFEATGEPNAHELSITIALSQHFPLFIPQVLGVHSSWNGWLAREVPGGALDGIVDWPAWEQAAAGLAEFQIASIGKAAELLDANLKDLRIPILEERIDAFLARMGALMNAQEKRTPAPLVNSELRSLAELLKEACALLVSLNLPDTVGHVDFNPGNILISGNRCVFVDWAEGCITNPLLTFEYLCEHMGRSEIKTPLARERLVSAYLPAWSSVCSIEVLRRALTLSPLLAVFAYAVASDRWRSTNVIDDSILAGYFRSLTRRMYREAIHAAVRSEACLS
jgi:hypothetical protein